MTTSTEADKTIDMVDEAVLVDTQTVVVGDGPKIKRKSIALFKAYIFNLATLVSPSLTGNPTAPTAPVGDVSQTVANTAFVTQAAIVRAIIFG